MYQTIRHTHYQQGSTTRSLEEFLELLQKDSNAHNHGMRPIAVNLVKADWTPRHYEILEWHILIWCSHKYSDDELYPMLQNETEEDEG